MAQTEYQKTTVEIDLNELKQAQRNLQSRGIKETVNSALREVNRTAALKRAAAYLLAGKLHVPDERAWAASRAPRL
ncbi:MAG TPA: hypothetical protein VIJ76_08135 [Galbitalea sp.]